MHLKKKAQVSDAAFMLSSLPVEPDEFSTDRFPIFCEGGELEEANALLEKASGMMALDNHSGAIELMSKAAELFPGHPRISQLKLRSESILLAMLESKLGDLEAVPFVQLRDEEILWLNIDRETSFVLSKVDGRKSLGQLLALPEIPRLELARILSQLMDDEVIGTKACSPLSSK
jgi:hypothetical protein